MTWRNYFTSLNLSFLICKNKDNAGPAGVLSLNFQGCLEHSKHPMRQVGVMSDTGLGPFPGVRSHLSDLIQSYGFKYHLYTEYCLPNFSRPEAFWGYTLLLHTCISDLLPPLGCPIPAPT